jgi:type I restriction enzyme S subunit
MRKYDSYKKSTFDWMGEIPSHWILTKNRYGFQKYSNGKNESDDTPVLSLTTRGVKVKTNLSFGKSTESYVGHQLVEKGDLVFTPRDFDQTPILSDVSNFFGCISNLYIVDKTKKNVLNHFVNYYWYGLKYSVDYFKNFSHGMRYSFNRFQFDEIPLLLPPLYEQQQIVSYLDTKTSLIDSLIEKTKLKIQLLKENRTSLINEVVTKGLNPNVEMKDSGVEWIGEIPSHWILGRIKHKSEIISKGTTPSTIGREVLDEGSIFYIKVENIKENTVDVPPICFIDKETDNLLSRSSLKENDILVVITGSTTGKVVILPKKFTPSNTNQGISFIRLKDKSDSNVKYTWFWLSSGLIQDQIKVTYTQSTQPNLSMEDLGNFLIPFPPLSEQQQIISYLDEHTQLIDKTISVEERRIDTLKEYRQSLISEVVTGKLKVVN